jgi:hypothetical protein
VATGANVTVLVVCVVVLVTAVAKFENVEVMEKDSIVEARGTTVDVLTYMEVEVTAEVWGRRVTVDVGFITMISRLYWVWTIFVPRLKVS